MKTDELTPTLAKQAFAQLAEQFGERAKMDGEIKANLAGLGYEF